MTVVVRAAAAADRARWDAYVAAAPHAHFAQLSAWSEVMMQGYGCPPAHLLAEQGGAVRGVLPLYRSRHALFSPPGGLLADDEEIARALLAPAVARVQRERLRWLELRDQRRAWPGLETSLEHCTLELPLEPGEDRQWSALAAPVRNQIRKGQRLGVTVRADGDVAAFHRVMLEAMRDLGTPLQARGFFERARAALGARVTILVAERGGHAVGAMFGVRFGGTFFDPWAASLRRHFDACPNMVLYWEALRRAVAAGCRTFDFGRSQWHSGTFRFKAQWGARPQPLVYQYALGAAAAMPTLAAQRSRYDVAVRVWQRLPLAAARALGAPLRRRFPEVL